jgi:hypothetical protein
MSNYEKHAFTEFKAAGWLNEDGTYIDEMQGMICDHVLKLLKVFDGEGHSGSSAPYAINLFSKLAKFETVAPLTGEDWEWNEVSERMGSKCWQNTRDSRVFKDDDGKAYFIEGKVFWEWSGTKEDPYKSHYTCRESRVYVEFPYTPKTEYVYRYSDATPPAPNQTEEGLL